MLVLGIDPGSTATGWGLVRREKGRHVLVEAGVVRTRSEDPIPERLLRIYEGLGAVITRHRPDAVAIEAIFQYRSAESALRLGQARGVALLVAAQTGVGVSEYNAMTVKKTVAGHGRAGKPEMVRVVGRLLGLTEDLPSDAADAVAIAITHLGHAVLAQKVAELRGLSA
jgi:crossover junction endodeoxyribonuclease RuvC